MKDFFTLSSILAFLSCMTLAVFVYLKGRDRLINRILALNNICIAFWVLFPFITNMIADERTALFWVRMIYIAAFFVPPLAAHFMLSLVDNKKLIKVFYGISVLMLFILPTPLFIKGITRLPYHSTLSAGPLFPVYILFFTLATGWPILVLFLNLQKTTGIRRNQIKYVFFGFTLGFIAAIIHFTPVYTGWSEPFPHDLLVIGFMFFLSYSIIKYKALEIETVIHRTVMWLLSLFFLILPFGIIYSGLRKEIFSLAFMELAGIVSVTLLVFLTCYNKLKPLIDHIFSRRKVSYQNVLAEMPSRIGSSLDLAILSQNLFRELKQVLYVRNALFFVKPPEKDLYEEFDSTGYDTPVKGEKPVSRKNISLRGDESLIRWMKETRKALEKEQVEVDPQYGPVKKEAMVFFSSNNLELLVPITLQDELIALLGLGKKANLQAYRVKDIELLENIGRQIGITIDNGLHHGDILEKERIAEELKLGHQIQMSLLPRTPPRVNHLSIQGFMQPAKEIGGDYYDFITLGQEDLGIVIGDVSGKGLAAGLLMAMVKTAIYIFARRLDSPKQTLLQINKVLETSLGGEKFLTMLYLIWQAESSSFLFSSAGHEHILIFRQSTGEIETLESGGVLLGVTHDIGNLIEEGRIQLSRRDKVLLYTDGVIEALNASRDRFGLARLKQTFQKHSDKPAIGLMGSIKDEVYAFMGTYPQSDDITLVVIEVN